jgi:PEP-CTERM motif
MNFKNVSSLVGLVAGSALSLSAAPAFAASFDFSTGTNLGSCAPLASPLSGQLSTATLPSCTTSSGFTLEGSPRNLQGKKVNRVTGVGVAQGAVAGEIDNSESIKMDLPGLGTLAEVGLSFLYRPGEQADVVYEVAKLVTNTGLQGILTITGNTTATWSFAGGSVVNLSPSNNSGGGFYKILNPFGNNTFSSVKFSTIPYAGVSNNYQNTDYSLVFAKSGSATAVPEPATLAGLAMVGGLVAASRRRKASKAS